MSERRGNAQIQTPEYLFEPDRCVMRTAETYDPSPEALQEIEQELDTLFSQTGTVESDGQPSVTEVAGVIANTVAQEITSAEIPGITPHINDDGVWQAHSGFDHHLVQVAAKYGEAGSQAVDLTAFNQWVHQLSLGDILAWVTQESKFMWQQIPAMVNSKRGEDPSPDIDTLDASLRDDGLDIALRDKIREHLAFAGALIRLPDGGVEVLELVYWLEHTIECPSQPPHVQLSALRLRATLDELYGGSLFDPLLPKEEVW
jgi:hypothetical protein